MSNLDQATLLHIYDEMKRLNQNVEKLDSHVQKIRVEIAVLKVKASIWGGLAGILPITVYSVWEYFKK